MTLTLHYVTDPACVRSWAAEPLRQRLTLTLGDQLEVRYVMGGLARDLDVRFADTESGAEIGRDTAAAMASYWLEVAAHSRMPLDPRLWTTAPLRSTYPVCLAVKAAQEQGPEPAQRFLRAARLGIACRRRRLDRGEALAELAAERGLERQRFEIDANSHAIVEKLGADIEFARGLAGEAADRPEALAATAGRQRLLFPALVFEGPRGRATAFGEPSWDRWMEAAEQAGGRAIRGTKREAADLLQELGPLATREIEELTQRSRAEVEAQLWTMAQAGQVRVERVLTGDLWQSAEGRA